MMLLQSANEKDTRSCQVHWVVPPCTTLSCLLFSLSVINAAFTLNGFDDQQRNMTFVKTHFQVLKLKF